MVGQINRDEASWQSIRRAARELLSRFGIENPYGEGDFWVLDDDWGNRENLIIVSNLDLLQPPIIQSLQALLRDAPNRVIVVDVDMQRKGLAWPPMGLTIRRDEIIDELKRDYLPTSLRDLRYPGGRPRDPSRDPTR